MRGESRSRSKSPTGSNDYRGDRGNNNDPPPSNKVYVTFLPEDIEEDQLKGLFQECGSVARLFLKKKQDGFTFAHIQYRSIDEAKNAVEKLNKRKVGSKNIRVQFSKQMNRGDSQNKNQRGDSREREDRGGRGDDHRRGSDTRRRFQNEGNGFERGGRGGGRGRGGGGFRDNGRNENRQGGRGQRGPMKCYKCQGEGHISKNCTNEENRNQRNQGGTESRIPKQTRVEKMSEDQDY